MRLPVLAALLLAAAPAAADDLPTLLADHWKWVLKESPVLASSIGVRDYERELGDPSLAQADRSAAQAAAFVARLDALPAASLSPADKVNAAILRRQLATQVEANSYPQRAINFSNRSGWHTYFSDLHLQLPLFTAADYDAYLARLEKIPAYAAASTEVTKRALADGQVLPCPVLGGFEKSITGSADPDPVKSSFYAPFLTRPATIAAPAWGALQTRAQGIVRDKVNPAYAAYAAFIRADYLPKCRATVAASALPGGDKFYAFRVRQETTTDLTPDAIHNIGLSEVARIRAEMDALVKSTGFAGDRKAYIAMLRATPKYYAKTPRELMAEVGLVTKTVDGWMPKLFGKLPKLPYTIREIPLATAEGTTTAYYNGGNLAAGVPGIYYVNTTKLDQRPLFEVPALSIHEAVPGHHHQIALAQEMELPPFRRYTAFFTGFVEGWGLYSERLGIEMGLYDTPEKNMGRLSYEMWRATRLVVDTGLHSKNWSKQQAVDFMLDNTALSAANIDAEVNRYIADPGQALAYKLGELTIRRLRGKAEAELGGKFDIRAFHDAVLENGAMPLDLLEAQMGAWLTAQKTPARTGG